MTYQERVESGDNWTLYLGDSVKTIDNIETESVGLIVFSPPFPSMYVYTNSPQDMGNTRNVDEMITHFSYLVTKDKLMRVLKPGRSCCIHLTQGLAFKHLDGYVGLKDFRGRVIQLMEDAGWIYYGEVAIDKNPQLRALRSKDQGLLFKSLVSDAAKCRPALADYILIFHKLGENPEPIRAGLGHGKNTNDEGWISNVEWVEWASPVWYRKTPNYPGGISETDVLNVNTGGRAEEDEKHLCPLQMGVIERCIKLWSNPGDIVYSPFAGIGSELYEALRLNRKAVGGELKESYFNVAVRNCKSVVAEKDQLELEW